MLRVWGAYTAISRKVVGKNVHATIPKGNMGYDQYTVPDDCSCRTYFCCFPLALANICQPSSLFFLGFLREMTLKMKCDLKHTQNIILIAISLHCKSIFLCPCTLNL